MRSAWPFVRAAFRELWPVAVVGLLGGAALAIAAEIAPTFALAAVAFAGLWGGVTAGGGSKGKLVHLLARPFDRRRMLAARVGTLAAVLLPVGVAVYGLGLAFGGRDDGPSVALMFVAIGVCTLAGVLAGALADSETAAVGTAFVGATLVLLPAVMFSTAIDITWARVANALGWLEWPFALAIVATAMLPVAEAWNALPCPTARSQLRAMKSAVGVGVLQFALGWAPVAVVAADPQSGEPIGLMAGPSGSRMLLTGSRVDDGDPVVDGIVLLDGEEQRTFFDSSALHALTGGLTGTIDRVQVSPDGHHVAIAVRESNRTWSVVVVDAISQDSFEIEDLFDPQPVWSRDGTHLLIPTRTSTVPVYRVGNEVEYLSEHSVGFQARWASLKDRDDVFAVDGLAFVRSEAPSDIGGGWQGNELFEIEGSTLHMFEGRTRTTRSVPIHVDVAVSGPVGSTWIDDRHLAVLSRIPQLAKDSSRSLYVIDRDGTVVAEAPVFTWFGLREIVGPPQGPWIVLLSSGQVEAWMPDGTRLWQELLLPYGLRSQLRFVVDDGRVAGVGRDGSIWEHEVPWKEDAL